jgi:hypothetical protein
VAALAAVPHIAAAGAPPLIAASTAQGSNCLGGSDATAALELKIDEPAINMPVAHLNPKLAIQSSGTRAQIISP